jgi:hypothetical protein
MTFAMVGIAVTSVAAVTLAAIVAEYRLTNR